MSRDNEPSVSAGDMRGPASDGRPALPASGGSTTAEAPRQGEGSRLPPARLAGESSSDIPYPELIDSMPLATLVYEPGPAGLTLPFTAANAATCRLLGYSRAELLTRSPSEISGPDVWTASAESQTGDAPAARRALLRASDGRMIPVEVTLETIGNGLRTRSAAFVREIVSREAADGTPQCGRTNFFQVFRHAPAAMVISTIEDGTCLDLNESAARLFGVTAAEMVGQSSISLGLISTQQRNRLFSALSQHGRVPPMDLEFTARNGRRICSLYAGEIVTVDGQPRLLSILTDMTDRRRYEAEREVMLELLRLLDTPEGLRDLIGTVTGFLQEWSGCEAVGIRLEEGDDYPYFETRGFPHTFVHAENSLCSQDPDGDVLRDSVGSPVLECMCGNVIRGRFNPALPFFTENGTFWTNSTSRLLASTTECERHARTRNRCNGEGYESVALIPLRTAGRTLGLLQLNSRRENCFDPALISLLEHAAGSVAIAIEQRQAQAALRRSEEQFRAIADYTVDWESWFSPEGKLLWVNPAVERFTGYSPGECRRLPEFPLCVVLERDREIMRGCFESALRGQSGADVEFRVVHRDGTVRWCEIRWQPILDASGGPLGHRSGIRDITARKRADQALLEANRRLEMAQVAAGAGLWDWDVVTGRAEWSAQFFDLFGLDPGRVTPGFEAWESVVHPEDRTVGRERILHALGARAELNSEFRVVLPGGRVRWVNALGRGVYDSRGRTLHMAGICIDITARKEAEWKLHASQEDYRRIVETAAEGIWVVDADWRTIFTNARLREMLGYPVQDLTGRGLAEFVSAEALPALLKHMAGREQGAPEGRDFQFVRADGSPVWVLISATPLADPSGRFAGAFAMLTDVTERHRTEEELRASEEKFRQLAEGLREVSWVCSPDWNHVFYVNPAYEEVWGRSREGLYANPPSWLETVVEEDRPLARADLERRIAGDFSIPESPEVRIRRPDGSVRWVQVRTYPIADQSGRVIRVAGLAEDVTVRKQAEFDKAQLEEQLRQSQKLESIGRLAGGVAHDFNNLLTVINGYTDLALATLPAGDPLRANLQEVKNAGERAAALTRQLLAFSRRQILQPRLLDLDRVVGDLRHMIARLIGENIKLEITLESAPAMVRADPGQIQQVLMNLVVNAKDAMPAGGQLTIGTRKARAAELRGHALPEGVNWAVIAVGDTGAGMDPEVMSHLFEPFFTTKEMGKGTGLGLSIVHGIVAQSGGHIIVDSSPERGSTFRILLPLVEKEAGTEPSPAGSHPLSGRETILVVEDQAQVLNYVANTLRAHGYRLLTAANAGEALMVAEAEKHCIDLLLTDVIMPILSGRELAKRLRRSRPDVKVLYMSGYTGDPVDSLAASGSGFALLQKPFTAERLLRAVRESLGPPVPMGRVLVADEVGAVRSLLRLVLSRAGFEVHEADDKPSALRCCQNGEVDLAIVSLGMPQPEGSSWVQELRQKAPRVAVIAVLDTMDLSSAALLGADSAISKPISPDELIVTVKELLARGR